MNVVCHIVDTVTRVSNNAMDICLSKFLPVIRICTNEDGPLQLS